MISRLAGERSDHHGSTERELTVEQGKVLNEELKHNIKDAIRENVTLHVVTPEEAYGEEDDGEEENTDDTADFVMDAVDSLTDEQLAALKARIAEREKEAAPAEKTETKEDEKTEE